MTLNWIDENERRDNHEELKRKVRSHVRRGNHARQKRLNEAARRRPVIVKTRKLAKKDGDTNAELSTFHNQQDNGGVPRTLAPRGRGQGFLNMDTVEPVIGSNIPRNQVAVRFSTNTALEPQHLSSPDISPDGEESAEPPLFSRAQFDNSKFYLLKRLQK